MTIFKPKPPKPPKHICARPALENLETADFYRCDECHKLWQVTGYYGQKSWGLPTIGDCFRYRKEGYK